MWWWTGRDNLNPDSNLANSTVYTVTVVGGTLGVKDVDGNPLPSSHIFSFTTVAADTTAPTITTKVPDSGATDVAVNANVVITFSEAMNQSRVTDQEIELFQTSNSANIPRAVTLNAAKTIATVNPNNNLGGGIQYTCRVNGTATPPSVVDLAGNPLAADVSWNSTTIAPSYTLIYDLSAHGTEWSELNHSPYKGNGLRLESSSRVGSITSNPPLFGDIIKKMLNLHFSKLLI